MPDVQTIRGACGHDCPDTCAWQVDVRAGTAVAMRGDPDHPFTRGTLCAKVNHYLERVYHPDRVLHPLKRVGAKGEGRFVRVGWDEALADIAARWQAIVAESGAEAILPYSSAGVQGVIQEAALDRRLFGSMGCSQLERATCGAVASAGLRATLGIGSGIDPEDIVHSRYVVLWGTNTIVTNLHFWPHVREAQRRGAKLVVVDPIRTRTADAADWHLPVAPGSDATLALAMMHVMVRDGLVDREYVDVHAVGYDALVARVRDYAPAAVASAVGLPPVDIERFAREYATSQPSLLRPADRNRAPRQRSDAVPDDRVPAGAERRLEVPRRRARPLHACTAPRRARSRRRPTAGHGSARRPHAEHARSRRRSLQRYAAAADSRPDRPRRESRGLDAQPGARRGRPAPRRSLHGRPRPVRDRHRQVRRLRAAGDQPDRASRPVAGLGPSLSGPESSGHPAARRGGLQHGALPPPRACARPHRAVALRERRIHAAGRAVERASVARGHHLRAAQRAGLRAPEPAGGLAPLRERRLPDAFREGGALVRAAARGRPRSAAGWRTAPACLRPAAHLRQDAPLPQLRLRQHRPPSASRRGAVRGAVRRRCARGLASGDAVRVWNASGEVRAVCRVSDRVRPGLAWMPFGGHTDAAGVRRSVNALTAEAPTDWGGGSGLYDAVVEIEACSASVGQGVVPADGRQP